MKRILTTAIFLICSLLATFAQFSGPGSGTKNDPYIIMSADQLYSVRNFLDITDVYFSIICDIDLSDYAYGSGWEPIGTYSSPFKGKIDGNGFKITGLVIKKSTKNNVGLFGCTYQAVLKNITVEGNILGNDNVGGIAGNSLSSAYHVEYENVHFKGTINGNNYVGGIAGQDSPNIGWTPTGVGIEYNKCSFEGPISGNDYLGGIVGSSSSKITNCKVDATINANQYVGGISGKMEGSMYNLIENSYVSINLSATSGFVGGVSGNGTGGDIKKCVVNGNIEALGDKVGGIIGYATCYSGVSHDFYISDSYFVGSLKANDYVGGIIGYNGGDVWQNKHTYVYWGYIRVENNYVKASIAGHDKVGGILSGYTSSNNPIIQSNVCMCTTIDSETENVGRIQARRDGATPKKCYSIFSTKVRVAGVNISEEDIEVNTSLHGTDIGENNLKTATFYQGLSWDFASTWGIIDTESVPYLQTQAAPPVIQSSLASGETTIFGNSFDGGNVRITIDGSVYVAPTNNNKWSITVPELQSGTSIVAKAETDDLFPSYNVECHVTYLGEGTPESPFLVRTYSDLKNMHGNGYYKLDNDIDLANSLNEVSPLEGWQPLGLYSEPITNFDGGNHKISNLFISRNDDLVGLFSNLTDATIKNLTIEVAEGKNIEGREKVGILAGRLNNCSIDNVTITGTVKGESIVGGLAGQINEGNVNNVIITESSIAGKNYIGGIAGTTSAIITQCSFDGNVSDVVAENDGFDNSATVYAGGITAVSKGSISESKVTGNVTATRAKSIVGGLVGDNYSMITNSYCTANVSGGTYAAGIAATNYSIVKYCYASGNITTTNTSTQTVSCGLIAYNNDANAIVTNCAAMNRNIISLSDIGTVFRVIGGITNGAPIPGNRNYTLQNMVLSINGIRQSVTDNPFNGYKKDDEYFTSQTLYTDNGWDFASVWGIEAGVGYPYLKAIENTTETPSTMYNLIYWVDGEEYKTVQLAEGDMITPEANPTKDGYTFSGWSEIPTTMPAHDVTVTGTFVEVVNPDDTDISQYENVVFFEKAEAFTGKQMTLSLKMNNTNEITGFQCDIYLPEGMTFAKDEDGYYMAELSTERTTASKTNIFDAVQQNDGALRVLASSTKNAAFSGNSGEVATIVINVSEDMTDGNYPIVIKSIELADKSGNNYSVSRVKSTVTVVSYLLGDVNADGKVNVADITVIANNILNLPNTTFIEAAADLNGDGKVNVADITSLANLILYGNITGEIASAKAMFAETPKIMVSIPTMNIQRNNTVLLPVNISNSNADFSAFQFDVTLPAGVEIVDASVCASRKPSNQMLFNYAKQKDGTFRIMGANLDGRAFAGNNGDVVLLTLAANEAAESGAVEISEIVLAENGNSYTSTKTIGILTVNDPTGIDCILRNDGTATVYNINGVVVKPNATAEDIKQLPQGIYIINGQKISKP